MTSVGEDGLGPRAEIGDDQPGGPEGVDAIAGRVLPRRSGLPDHQRFRGPAGPAERAYQDGGGGEAIGIEMAEDDDRAVPPERRECIRHRRACRDPNVFHGG